MPYALTIGEPGDDRPVFTLPFWTRKAAEREAAVARTKRGVGFIITPYLSLPGRTHPEGQFLWAKVAPMGWRDFLRRKLP